MQKIHVLARYVNIPECNAQGKPLNFDLARSANPIHMDVAVEGLAEHAAACVWFDSQDEHSGACIFPLAQLDPADRTRVRRALKKARRASEPPHPERPLPH